MQSGFLPLALLFALAFLLSQAETKSIIVPHEDEESPSLQTKSTKQDKPIIPLKLGPEDEEDENAPDATLSSSRSSSSSSINLRGSDSVIDTPDPLAGDENTETEPAPAPRVVLPKVGRKSKEAFTKALETCPDTTRIVFLGDTTFAKLRQQPAAMEALHDYGTANIAIEGYQVEMMDEFIRRINLHNLAQASLAVIMIGAENIAKLEKSDSVFDKLVGFVDTVRQKFDAGTKIIILSILPRDSPGLNRAIATVNTRLINKYKAYSMVRELLVKNNFPAF